MQLEAFFCSAKFTSEIGDFMARRGPDLEFKPLDEEQPFRCVTLNGMPWRNDTGKKGR